MKIFICKILHGVLLLGVLSLIISCDNFMESSVKKEIENSIYIANHNCPVVTVEEPVFSDAGVAKNKAIIIKFSIPVDPQTFAANFSIEDSTGTDLSEYFMKPEWSNSNTVVTIAANELNLINLNGKSTMDIYVKLSKKCMTTDNLPITDALNHRYRITDKIDNTPPEITLVNAELPPEYIYREAQEDEEPKLLIEGSITAENEETICTTNHINTKLDFYIEGKDYGGGKIWGVLKYHRIFDAVGNAVNEEEEIQVVDFEEHLIN